MGGRPTPHQPSESHDFSTSHGGPRLHSQLRLLRGLLRMPRIMCGLGYGCFSRQPGTLTSSRLFVRPPAQGTMSAGRYSDNTEINAKVEYDIRVLGLRASTTYTSRPIVDGESVVWAVEYLSTSHSTVAS
jgi:hypothetical protein